MSTEEKLQMSFDPNTIQHLGIKMYSNLPSAVAELIANSYDADANVVKVKLFESKNEKSICIEDDGHGMSFSEVNSCFLRIGRNRRSEDKKQSPKGRTVTGKKGLGKLALFGIGEEVTVETKHSEERKKTVFTLSWAEIKNCHAQSYEPKFDTPDDLSDASYTKITIGKLKRKTNFDVSGLISSIAKMFNFFDDKFKLSIYHNDSFRGEITNKLKFDEVDAQFTWNYLTDFSGLSDYDHKNDITGRIITTEKPLKANLRGITLFANGRMVNLPEFFGRPESSHFYSYTTGWLNVDFVDNAIGEDDLISTNRQSLDWEKDETISLRNFLQEILAFVQRDWRAKRKELNKKSTQEKTGIDREKWLSSVPKDKADVINKALDAIAEPDSADDPVTILEAAFHAVVPEYAQLHWRFLNSAITESKSVGRLYQQENYFQAASEAVKMYIAEVRRISGSTDASDHNMMMKVFDWDVSKAVISLTNRTDAIERDIEGGQKHYSGGVVTGFKNPVASHATEDDLKRRGLFSEKDCLDVLSLLSHLFDRLNKRISPR